MYFNAHVQNVYKPHVMLLAGISHGVPVQLRINITTMTLPQKKRIANVNITRLEYAAIVVHQVGTEQKLNHIW